MQNEIGLVRLERWLYPVALGTFVLIPIIAGLTQAIAHFDDAYITYRYAHNLAIGRGFVYNSGEVVLGTSAPLYGLILALASKLGFDIPHASHALSIVGWATSVLLVERIGRVTGGRALGLMAAALTATSPLLLSVIGMETDLMIAFALGAIYLHLARHTRAAFVVAALATWVRPDCALVAGVIGLAYVFERRAVPWREGLLYVVTLLPWLAYAQITYGSILPNSLFAKAGQGRQLYIFGWGLINQARSLFSANMLYGLIGLLGMVGFAQAAKRRPRWLIVVIWAGLYIASYLVLKVPDFPWYYPPVWPAIALLTSAGILAVSRFFSRLKSLARSTYVWSTFLLMLVLFPQFQVMGLDHFNGLPPHDRGYIAVADWLKRNTASDASIAMLEIGIIGYYSDRHVVDVLGLISPGMIGHLYSWDQTLYYAMTHYWPDYAVSLQGTSWDYIKREPWFQEAYAPVTKIPSAGPGSRSATIFKRNDGFPVRTFELERAPLLTADDAIHLLAVRIQNAQLQPGGVLRVQLEWRATKPVQQDDKVILDLVNAQTGQRRTVAIEQPMHGGNPTFLWKSNDVILDDHTLTLPSNLGPGVYQLEVKMLDVLTDDWLTFKNSSGQVVSHVAVGPLWLGPKTSPTFQISQPLQATFGDLIHFEGFTLGQPVLTAGEPMSLTLYWQAREAIEEDYTVFVHILDRDGNLIAQQDNPPRLGDLPTSLWLPGVIVPDSYEVQLPDRQAVGEYHIRIGMYRADTQERLALDTVASAVQDRTLYLTTITLK